MALLVSELCQKHARSFNFFRGGGFGFVQAPEFTPLTCAAFGIIHEYPRYGKQRVETVYQLRDFFSLFYLKFIDGRQVSAGGWLSKDRTGAFNSWAGDTFELLCFEHLSQIKNALRLPSIDRRFSWRGTSPEGKGAQIDLVIECNAARTDYLCEMKFCADNFVIVENHKAIAQIY